MADHAETRGWARPALLAALAALALFVGWQLRGVVSYETLRDNRVAILAYCQARPVLTAGLFMAAYVAIVALSLPGATIATLTGGFLFGTAAGTLLNATAATAGAVLLFLAVRWGIGARLAARIDSGSGPVRRLKQGIDRNQWSVLFLMRLVPAVPFFVANLVPALLDVPLHRFVVSTFFGILPGAVIYTSVGAGLGEVFEGESTPDLGIIFHPSVGGPLVALAALACLPILVRQLRRT